MKNNVLKPFTGSTVFFCLGIFFLIMGVNGKSVAVFVSRPLNESSWLTSERMVDSFTYIPMFIGVFLLVLAVVTFAITLNNWLKSK